MTEDDSESYNLVNIHAPTANLEISIVFGLVVAIGLYRLYGCFLWARWCKPGGGRNKGRRRPVPPSTASIDMTGYDGQGMPKQMAVYGGGDAKNAYWQLKEERCMDCIESLCLEEAWRLGEQRRPKERFAQEAQVEGHPRRVGGHQPGARGRAG